MAKKLIVGNWKMNLAPGEASLLVGHIAKKLKGVDLAGVDVVLCAPFIDLHPLSKELDRVMFRLGAQTLNEVDHGPYTGEISGSMLKGLVSYVIIGHSERRAMGERDKHIAKKLAAAVRNGLQPILCIGETLTEREHKLSEKVIVDQLTAALAMMTAEDMHSLVIAYEPVWAINHHDGKPVLAATPDQIKFAYRAIRTTLEELYGEAGTAGVRLLYGGSVDADHATAYLQTPYVDGLLVGTASLNPEDFAKIVTTAASQ